MQPSLSSDQEFLAETTRRFLGESADSSTVRALRADPRGFDTSYWRQGCDLGWTSLLVAEQDGGGTVTGEGVADLALLAYEFGRRAAPGPLITTNVVADAISRRGSAAQKSEVLPGLLSGELIASWAFAEAQPNDGLGQVTLTATEANDKWQLRGRKVAVESAGDAAYFLVVAQAQQRLVQLLVPRDAAGITIRPMGTVDLTRRFASVAFDDVCVEATATVGEPQTAAADIQRQLQVANALQCAEMVGALDTAFDMTVEWAFNRYSFGRPLASYQALKHRFADMKSWLEASHALADSAVAAVQAGRPNADELVSAAKAYVGHYGTELCHECVQLHGGIGVTYEHDLHLYLRRVTLNALLFGTVTDHRMRLADILEQREREGSAA